MRQTDYTLQSGAKLHLSSAPWDKTFDLWSAVKVATLGQRENPEVGHLILASQDVQKCIREVFHWATYDSIKLYVGFFDEPKTADQARGDYLEICEKMIEFHLSPFFFKTSSGSTGSSAGTTKSPESQ